MKKKQKNEFISKYIRYLKETYLEDNDFKIVSIVFMISYLVGYTIVLFDLTNTQAFSSQLTIPYSLEKDLFGYEVFRGYLVNYLLVLLLGTLFVLPLFSFVPFVGIANGSALPLMLANENVSIAIAYLVLNLIFIKYFMLLSHFSAKIGKWLIYLFLKKPYKIEFKLIILPSILLVVLIILNFIFKTL
ncbi:MAG: hypothetical protein QW524_00830 [Candidatus Woesearchaeota archaeon]